MAISHTEQEVRSHGRLDAPVFGRLAYLVDWLLLVLAPVALVLVVGKFIPHRVGEVYPAGAAAALMFVAAGVCLSLVVVRAGLAVGGADDAILHHPRSAVLRLLGAVASFFAGVAFAYVVNRTEGALLLGQFFSDAGPIVAGFVVGIVFAAVSSTERRHCALRAQRVIGVGYMLAGAFCAVLGTLEFRGHNAGYAYGCFFLAISGSFAASTYILLEMVVVSTEEKS